MRGILDSVYVCRGADTRQASHSKLSKMAYEPIQSIATAWAGIKIPNDIALIEVILLVYVTHQRMALILQFFWWALIVDGDGKHWRSLPCLSKVPEEIPWQFCR